MRNLITGASGFLGANLVRHLLRREEEVHVLIRTPTLPRGLADLDGRIVVHRGDLCDPDQMMDIIRQSRPARIFNLATYGGHAHQGERERIFNVNVNGLKNIMEVSRRFDTVKSFIQAGSSSEYGRCSVPMREDMPLHPVGAYAESKAEATRHCLSQAANAPFAIMVARIFSPFGPWDAATRLIPSIILSALQQKSPTIKNGRQVRDYVYVDDVCEALVQCGLAAHRLNGMVLNVGSGEERTIKAVAVQILQLMDTKLCVNVAAGDLEPVESPRWIADMTATKQALDWKPTTTFDDGLLQTVAWYRDHFAHLST